MFFVRERPWWVVTYEDGRRLAFGQIKYIDLERDKIKEFVLFSKTGLPIYTIRPTKNQTLIFRKRKAVSLQGNVKMEKYVCGVVEGGIAKLSLIDVMTGEEEKLPPTPYEEADIQYLDEELVDIRKKLDAATV